VIRGAVGFSPPPIGIPISSSLICDVRKSHIAGHPLEGLIYVTRSEHVRRATADQSKYKAGRIHFDIS
jgi:hypothetical protein